MSQIQLKFPNKNKENCNTAKWKWVIFGCSISSKWSESLSTVCSIFSAFSLGKRKLLSALCPSVRPSVTASSLQGVVGLGWFIACSKAYEPRIWITVKKILGIDPGRGQEGLKSLILYIFLEYLWTFYKCVCEWER